MEMGRRDELVITDNFPAHRLGQRVIHADGHRVPELLDAILTLCLWILTVITKQV